MSCQQQQLEELAAAIFGLGEVRRLVSDGGRQTFDSSEDRRRALAFCWVSVGSALKHYSAMARIPQGSSPLSEPIRFRDRLAHQRLDKLNDDVLWATSVRDTPAMLRIVEQLRDQLSAE